MTGLYYTNPRLPYLTFTLQTKWMKGRNGCRDAHSWTKVFFHIKYKT